MFSNLLKYFFEFWLNLLSSENCKILTVGTKYLGQIANLVWSVIAWCKSQFSLDLFYIDDLPVHDFIFMALSLFQLGNS